MRQDAIEILRYSTADLPPEERYTAWLARSWPRVDAIYRTQPIEPFDTLFESTQLGEILFVYTEITAMRWERRLQDIRSSDFDPLIVNMMVKGAAQGVFDGREFREVAGNFHFHDLARPSLHVSTASRTFSIVMPRPVARDLFGNLDDLHGLVVRGACAELVLAHSEQVWRVLGGLDPSTATALSRSLLDLLVVAATQARSSAPPQASRSNVNLRRRAEAVIDIRLNTPIAVPDLCDALNVSRKRIFAAFKADGGVLNYIRMLRLDRAKSALADLERSEPIGTIALRLGFCDASHLTRLFRARFGMTPREYRRLISDDEPGQIQ